MTDKQKEQILSLYKSGMPISKIRRMTAMSVEDFNKAIKEMERNGDFAEKKTTMQKVIEAFERGERNIYEIAELYGISPTTVETYRVRAGIKVGKAKRNYRYSERTNNINEDLRLKNATVAEIARKHGVSWTRVKFLKKRLEEDGEL